MQALLIPDTAAAAVAPSFQRPPRGRRRFYVRAPWGPSAPRKTTDPKKRVVITGMGVVSVFGNDVGVFYNRLLAGKNGVVPIDRFDASGFPTRFAAQIRDFYSEGLVDGRHGSLLEECQRYALVAAKKPWSPPPSPSAPEK